MACGHLGFTRDDLFSQPPSISDMVSPVSAEVRAVVAAFKGPADRRDAARDPGLPEQMVARLAISLLGAARAVKLAQMLNTKSAGGDESVSEAQPGGDRSSNEPAFAGNFAERPESSSSVEPQSQPWHHSMNRSGHKQTGSSHGAASVGGGHGCSVGNGDSGERNTSGSASPSAGDPDEHDKEEGQQESSVEENAHRIASDVVEALNDPDRPDFDQFYDENLRPTCDENRHVHVKDIGNSQLHIGPTDRTNGRDMYAQLSPATRRWLFGPDMSETVERSARTFLTDLYAESVGRKELATHGTLPRVEKDKLTGRIKGIRSDRTKGKTRGRITGGKIEKKALAAATELKRRMAVSVDPYEIKAFASDLDNICELYLMSMLKKIVDHQEEAPRN